MPATYYTYNTPFGHITIAADGEAITRIAFGSVKLEGEPTPSVLTNKAANELQEYFAGKRQVFDLPLAPAGSEFQREVWAALERIPYGETRSYKDVAVALGKPGASRAVGGANNANPLPVVIPCHRVINANGTLGGYAGGEKVKRFLLELEAAHRDA